MSDSYLDNSASNISKFSENTINSAEESQINETLLLEKGLL